MHTSAKVELYLHAASNPIMESCAAVRFAPYPRLPPPLAGALGAAGLRPEANLWDRVGQWWAASAESKPHTTRLYESKPHATRLCES